MPVTSCSDTAVERAEVSVNSVLDLIRRVSGDSTEMKDLDADAPFAEMLDSLGMMEVRNQLEDLCGGALPGSLLFDHGNARDLTEAVLGGIHSPKATPDPRPDAEPTLEQIAPSVLVLKPGEPDLTPLFGVPDITGSCTPYSRILTDHPIYALQLDYLQNGDEGLLKATDTIDRLATFLAEAVLVSPVCLGAAFHVLGMSFGGMLAPLVASAAKALGGNVNKLILIDPVPPGPWSKPPGHLLTAAGAARFLLLLHQIPDMDEVSKGLDDVADDALALRVAEHLSALGAIKFSAAGILSIARRMRMIMHNFHIIGEHVAQSSVAAGVHGPFEALLVLAKQRSSYFMDVYGLSSEESGFGPARSYATVANELFVDGDHIACCIKCTLGRDAEFTTELQRFLQPASE